MGHSVLDCLIYNLLCKKPFGAAIYLKNTCRNAKRHAGTGFVYFKPCFVFLQRSKASFQMNSSNRIQHFKTRSDIIPYCLLWFEGCKPTFRVFCSDQKNKIINAANCGVALRMIDFGSKQGRTDKRRRTNFLFVRGTRFNGVGKPVFQHHCSVNTYTIHSCCLVVRWRTLYYASLLSRDVH